MKNILSLALATAFAVSCGSAVARDEVQSDEWRSSAFSRPDAHVGERYRENARRLFDCDATGLPVEGVSEYPGYGGERNCRNQRGDRVWQN